MEATHAVNAVLEHPSKQTQSQSLFKLDKEALTSKAATI